MSLSNPKISLIIPVYNVEKYIRKTLESVLAQTFTDYEVIMVNDGSTDGSLAVLKEYADKYENFKLINQNNCGSSKARNVGINEAAGDYLAFLDSDDFLKPDFLEVLYSSAEENGADIACCNYYLYYEKNPGMQTYMIDKNEELQPEPQEKYEDQAVKDFRKIIADKKETRKEPAAPSVFSYGLTACLAIAVLTVGVNFYRSYQNVKQNEKESATVSSVIVEEITPSPVVGTSNNEAVRQHKQYRTDTIQNDAGKNKKNNEENDEENNQSTSEKENSEKKNNTSEKKISAEQTDTEQKSDKTEQLPDVKTEKADKTEQIYQQEADERKAQKRVREAVQKENSEAAGKAHESYVIQPGDTLFQISMDRYGSIEAISQICKLNGMSADEIIYPGQVIVLP